MKRRPGMRLELAPGRRVRLSSKAGPVLWGRIESYWEQWARLSNPDARPHAVAKIAASAVRAAPSEAGSDGWWSFWAKHFAAALFASDDAPLYALPWWLEPVRGAWPGRAWWDPALPAPARWQDVNDDLGVREAEPLQMNQVVPLRAASPLSADRVKVWRKHARAGTLPPVLLWYVPAGLELFFVLDGHDRLRAAAAEKATPHFLALAPAEIVQRPPPSPHSLEMLMAGMHRAYELGRRRQDLASLNAAVIDAHRTSHRRIVSRAWPVTGGAPAWDREVRSVCARLGVDPEVIGLL